MSMDSKLVIVPKGKGYIDLNVNEWGVEPLFNSFIAAHRDGTCLVARDKAMDNDVRQALDKLASKISTTLRFSWVTMQEVAEARRLGKAGSRTGAVDGMQGAILDMIEVAHRSRASDIHIEVGNDLTIIRLRVDGRLIDHDTWSPEKGRNFLGAAYAMADLANSTFTPTKFLGARLAPRAGRDSWAFPEGIESVRMQFDPIAFGYNYAVFRLLGVTDSSATIESLGYEEEQIPPLTTFAMKSKGLGIISGPTGSGKSTTMCALIERSREMDIKSGTQRALFTVEDPPERRLVGAMQLAVNNTDSDVDRLKAFADAIRAALRSDPDQIVVGEIRDGITADLSVTASMTGHQVWSTLHCTSAHAIPFRLIDLGVERSKIYNSDELYLAVAQVLVPLLCQNCKIPFARAVQLGLVSDVEAGIIKRAFGSDHFFPGDGCDDCNSAGVKGRTVLAEVIRTDASYLDVLSNQGMAAAREFSIARGEPSMACVGQRKVIRGEVCARDVVRMVDVANLEAPKAKVMAA